MRTPAGRVPSGFPAGLVALCAKLKPGLEVTVDATAGEREVSLEATDRAGHLHALVEITPDHRTRSHRFAFEVDRSYLLALIGQCSAIAH